MDKVIRQQSRTNPIAAEAFAVALGDWGENWEEETTMTMATQTPKKDHQNKQIQETTIWKHEPEESQTTKTEHTEYKNNREQINRPNLGSWNSLEWGLGRPRC